jgi:hypothetical protein
VELADGRTVSAAFGDLARLEAEGHDISRFGSFAAYMRARRTRKLY